jgi:ATP-dependent helicase/nuclease subunit A
VETPPFAFYEDTLLWLPPTTQEISLTKEIKQHLKLKQQEEYHRLLYVALTRAEDALYVCGWEATSQNSWYNMVKAGLQKVGEEFDFGEEKGLRLSSLKKGENTPYKPSTILAFSSPYWLRTPPLPEAAPLFLTPSKLEAEEAEFHQSTFGEFGARRGTLIHKLLEFLPSLLPDLRERAAKRFLEKEGIPPDLTQEMIETALKSLNTYPDFYTPSSLGEVSFEGKLGETWVSGQIDRLVIMEEQILIIDYKTHREAPSKLEDIPPSLLKQMAIYRDIVTKIYTEHAISCGILWTSLPRFDVLPHEILKDFTSNPDPLANSLDLKGRCAYFKDFKELETFS